MNARTSSEFASNVQTLRANSKKPISKDLIRLKCFNSFSVMTCLKTKPAVLPDPTKVSMITIRGHTRHEHKTGHHKNKMTRKAKKIDGNELLGH